ncbi:MAG: type-F conjugative transfer system pilin assembly protein TrbC [Sphingomonadales bacterium]|nr:type-F conjugative transfer system pilin assembly protein TrbC [Sphingomonadaceae bacterium]MBS3932552.1 type-F conjugative transfer system pilin assembly protein TrbC [Sphingomonadales bacterium]
MRGGGHVGPLGCRRGRNGRGHVGLGLAARGGEGKRRGWQERIGRYGRSTVFGRQGHRVIAFASLSMPAQALRQMMDDVTRAGGVVVFRGLTKGSAKVMTGALGKVLGPGERMDGVGIDPRLFRAFQVSEVPAYVVTATDFDLCSGFDCTSGVPPFDRLNGNVTAEYALRTFATGGGPGARIAAQHLARLTGDQP